MRIKALLFCSLLSLLSLASLADAAQTITNVYIGTSANAGNGDPLRTAMIKLNTNDTFLATTLAGKLDTTNGFSYYDLAGVLFKKPYWTGSADFNQHNWVYEWDGGQKSLLQCADKGAVAGKIFYWGNEYLGAQSIRVGEKAKNGGSEPRITLAVLDVDGEELHTYSFHTNDIELKAAYFGHQGMIVRWHNDSLNCEYGDTNGVVSLQGRNVGFRCSNNGNVTPAPEVGRVVAGGRFSVKQDMTLENAKAISGYLGGTYRTLVGTDAENILVGDDAETTIIRGSDVVAPSIRNTGNDWTIDTSGNATFNDLTITGAGTFNAPVTFASSVTVNNTQGLYGKTSGAVLVNYASVDGDDNVVYGDTANTSATIIQGSEVAVLTGFRVSTAGGVITKTLTAQTALDFGSTSAQSSSDLTFALTGAVAGDAVSLGVPAASVLANTCYTAWVSATDTITVRFNNYSSAAKDPSSGTFSVFVVHF